MAGRGFIGLLRFGLLARGFFDQAFGSEAQLGDARFQFLLSSNAGGGVFGGLAQPGFQRGGLLAQSSYRLTVRGHARGQVVELALGDFDFHRQARGARLNLGDLLAIESDAIFGAIQVQRGLAQQVLGLAQFHVEFVAAHVEAFLLGFQLMDGSRFAAFGQIHFAQQSFDACGLDVEMFGFAGQHAAQQFAHLFTQFGVTPGLRGLAL